MSSSIIWETNFLTQCFIFLTVWPTCWTYSSAHTHACRTWTMVQSNLQMTPSKLNSNPALKWFHQIHQGQKKPTNPRRSQTANFQRKSRRSFVKNKRSKRITRLLHPLKSLRLKRQCRISCSKRTLTVTFSVWKNSQATLTSRKVSTKLDTPQFSNSLQTKSTKRWKLSPKQDLVMTFQTKRSSHAWVQPSKRHPYWEICAELLVFNSKPSHTCSATMQSKLQITTTSWTNRRSRNKIHKTRKEPSLPCKLSQRVMWPQTTNIFRSSPLMWSRCSQLWSISTSRTKMSRICLVKAMLLLKSHKWIELSSFTHKLTIFCFKSLVQWLRMSLLVLSRSQPFNSSLVISYRQLSFRLVQLYFLRDFMVLIIQKLPINTVL